MSTSQTVSGPFLAVEIGGEGAPVRLDPAVGREALALLDQAEAANAGQRDEHASVIELLEAGNATGAADLLEQAVLDRPGVILVAHRIDDEVIAAADEHGMAMVFTGIRHFRH